MYKLILSAAFSFALMTLSAQTKNEMRPANENTTYTTTGGKKPVNSSYNKENKESSIKKISRKEFESYPIEKRQAILNQPEKYIIED